MPMSTSTRRPFCRCHIGRLTLTLAALGSVFLVGMSVGTRTDRIANAAVEPIDGRVALVPRAPDAATVEPAFGSRIPPHDEPEYFGVVVSVIAMTESGPLNGPNLVVSCGTYNRLRDALGVSVDCDRAGFAMTVTAGPDAERWGIHAGATLRLVRWMDGSVALQRSLLVGDTWFDSALRIDSLPEGCDGA